MGFQAKYPGPKMLLRPVEMRFTYQDSFAVPSPDAYETLLWDVMNNDPTLFMRADQVEAAWQVLDAGAGGVGGINSSRFSQLRCRQLGAKGGRRVARARGARLEANRMRILVISNAFRGGYRLWTKRYGGSTHTRFVH